MIENLRIKELQYAILVTLIIKFFILIFINLNDLPLLIGDQSKYWNLADKIFHDGKFFGEQFGAMRVPLYPIFLNLLKKINNSVYFVLVIQSFLSAYIIYLIFIVAKLFSLETAKISLVLSILSVNLINSSIFILTESIFLIFFLLFIYYFLKSEKIKEINSNYCLILSSFFLGLSTLTRPLAFYFFPVILIILTNNKFDNKIKSLITFILVFGIVISPWCIRNYHYFDKYKLTNSAGPNLAGYYLPYLMSNKENIPFKESKTKIYEQLKNEIDYSKNPFYFAEQEKNFFFKKIDNYSPKIFVETWFEGNLKLFFSPPFIDVFYLFDVKKTNYSDINNLNFTEKIFTYLFQNDNKYYSSLLIVSILIIFLLRLLFFYSIFTFDKKDMFKILVFFSIILINFVLTGPIGSARYRIIVEPIFIILASISINFLITKYLKK